MITCVVCKRKQDESYYVELKYGGIAICIFCEDTEEGKRLIKESDDRIEAGYEERLDYEAEKRELVKNQSYEGQYDWM